MFGEKVCIWYMAITVGFLSQLIEAIATVAPTKLWPRLFGALATARRFEARGLGPSSAVADVVFPEQHNQ